MVQRLPSPRALLLLLLVAMATLVGCAGAPVQEMSNARQAVRAASNAGADASSPELMTEARQLLDEAKTSLDQHDYRAAREKAELSRSKAVEARRVAEQAKAPKPDKP